LNTVFPQKEVPKTPPYFFQLTYLNVHIFLYIQIQMDFMSFLEKNESKPWDWYGVSRNPNITMEFIDAHPEKSWDWRGVSGNPNLTKPE